jgi:hypothetical protein
MQAEIDGHFRIAFVDEVREGGRLIARRGVERP